MSPSTTAASARYCVVGNPVAHSLSPRIHAAFAAQLGEQVVYTAELVAPGALAEALVRLRQAGLRGLNVTVPFKEDAFRLADELTARARLAGAVNTLSFRADGTLGGDNTDGHGLVQDLRVNMGIDLAGARVLVVGAGGAARGIVGPLFGAGVGRLVIANRTRERAERLARDLADCGPIDICGFEALAPVRGDVIVNATSAGHGSDAFVLAPMQLAGCCCYDLSYGTAAAPFLAWAQAGGAGQASDGLGMLVEQAAESWFIWRGSRPATLPVINALRAGSPTAPAADP
jgi:shikimate dehydrogenase